MMKETTLLTTYLPKLERNKLIIASRDFNIPFSKNRLSPQHENIKIVNNTINQFA